MTDPPRLNAVPRHIAVIMDGNGRWARERELPRIAGHEKGAESVRLITEECVALGVEFLTVYAFSTENWKRPPQEVAALWALLEYFLELEMPTLMENRVRLATIGRIEELPEQCRTALADAIARTAANDRMTLVLALNYSSRCEIADAARVLCIEAAAGRLDPADVTADMLAGHLYTQGWPDPDLLIRTSGEMRLSNFLLWQLSYTEIYVTAKRWPDFGKEDLRAAVADYSKRERRFGGL